MRDRKNWWRFRTGHIVVAVALACGAAANAQSPGQPYSYPGATPARPGQAGTGGPPQLGGDLPRPPGPIIESQAAGRNLDRQRRLVADTQRLLQLAIELKTEVDKTNQNILSVDVVKKAEEIEKLAKSVKDRMKG
ncbi:hypothetical protein FTO74_11335 [Granulicella sp. WH15]|uniref:hypothetical protein n=1 Tax=Granulicella sp. WH15 TaxID=2602070 RepID=UPI001367456E|nr:hypothetical protein [Granulicella sp. WH15]QHN03900.1 hypothetical protein FTO74_11335 [Granulicella sp. WH15]